MPELISKQSSISLPEDNSKDPQTTGEGLQAVITGKGFLKKYWDLIFYS